MPLLLKILPIIGSSLVFMATEIGYFLMADQFQSERRTGWLAGDRVPMMVTIVLFLIFMASFYGTFGAALLLPFHPLIDAFIGLCAVSLATVGAYQFHKYLDKSEETETAKAA
ncbi:hypothetical protein JM93_01815 [Roseibium hamelinense]|uniref:Uncharacterized protein n=1 Tax=Roseibium hamelinense TaxID=150831 RepID=A0A562T7L1_9HYPH|nr:hypothetical protein [Roseibium hamelinense]MTI43000.1 hypothetical protein [Roseibium hamelinense]TWI89611.1 hypothetical protein JM93_01815 [Roseibium hamelinense]